MIYCLSTIITLMSNGFIYIISHTLVRDCSNIFKSKQMLSDYIDFMFTYEIILFSLLYYIILYYMKLKFLLE